MKITCHYLRETPHGKLGWRERRGVGPRPNARGRPGNQNGAAAAREHLRHDLPRPEKRAKCMKAPRLLKNFGCCLHQSAHRTTPTVVDQNVNRTQFASDLFVRGRDLLFDRRVTLDWRCDTTRRTDLVRNLFDDFRASGDERDLVTYSEAAGQ